MADRIADPTTSPTPSLGGIASVAVWVARVAWLLVAIVGGTAIGDVLADHSRPEQIAGTVGAWIGWSIGAAALAVPGVVTLTLARAVVPVSLVVAAGCVLGGVGAGVGVALIAPAAISSALVGSAEFGQVYVQASAYGDEHRFGLRPPLGYLAACAATWLLTATAVVVAPLAWAAAAWPTAIVTTAVAGVAMVLLPNRWHALSRRWLVLVPAGLVLHDPVVLADTVTVRAGDIASIGLADRGAATEHVADLTGPTPGAVVAIRLAAPVPAVLAATPSRPDGTPVQLEAMLVAPTRPGSVLRTAHHRGL